MEDDPTKNDFLDFLKFKYDELATSINNTYRDDKKVLALSVQKDMILITARGLSALSSLMTYEQIARYLGVEI